MDFHGYVLVYSITSQKSFEVIQIIYEKLLDVMGKAQWVDSDCGGNSETQINEFWIAFAVYLSY